ncbi:hypothetical protein [Propionicimonas paludicola]|nr:hypothetical protein [Propionicimonas paludicola]
MRRRVETVHIVDLKRVERRVTLDIDMERVAERARDAGVDGEHVRKLPVPLAMLQKTLLLDVDVRDHSGGAVSIATSHEDSQAAHATMLSRIAEHMPGIELSDYLIQKLYVIAKDMPSKTDYEKLVSGDPASRDIDAWTLGGENGVIPNAKDSAVWDAVFENEHIVPTIVDFTRLFMPTIYLRKDGGLTLVKLRYVERESIITRRRNAGRIGWEPASILIEAPAVGRAEREHLRLIAPPGLSLTEMTLARIQDGSPPAGKQTFERRVTHERGVLYSSGLQVGSYLALARLVPSAAEFAIPAMITTGISALLLLVGAWYQATFGILADAQSTIALLLLAPSTVAAYLTRRGEHKLLGRVLIWPKVLVGITVLGSLLAAGSMVLVRNQLGPYQVWPVVALDLVRIWTTTGAYSLLVAVVLAVSAIRGRMAMSKVDETPLSWQVRVRILSHR